MTLNAETLHIAGLAAGFFALGIAIGAAHFLSLRTSVRWITSGRVLAPVVLQVARHAVLIAALFAIVRLAGGVALVAAAAGVLATRALLMRRERREGEAALAAETLRQERAHG
ncbi:N-ATPase subunit AtpR [Acuticoccus sediminis]|uniref:N-ATPase subunit AtpR n=1 Tax=Acuticoccus sediminis TaxID=2184697 RepID=UPI001CFF3DC4|nr:ATP synthase subunit I [Acuticoccus sediminis]